MLPESAPIEIPLREFRVLREKAVRSGHREFSKAEIDEILVRAKRRDRRAIELVVLIYERFVIKKLRAAAKDGCDLNELLQEGRIRLLRAIELYDPTKSAFSTYLAQWLRSAHNYRLSSDPLIASKDPGKRRSKFRFSCIDAAISEDGTSLSEIIASDEPTPEDRVATKRRVSLAQAAIETGKASLSAQEKRVIEMRGLGEADLLLKEIAAIMNVSRERVRQVEASAIGKLQQVIPRDE